MKETIINIQNTNNGSIKKIYNIAFKWAIIGALVQFILTLSNYYMNGETMVPKDKTISLVISIIGIIIIVAVITLCIKEYRNSYSEGFITFKRGFFVGFMCSLFLALLTSFLTYLLYQFIIDYDTMISEQLDMSIQEMKKRKLSEEEIKKAFSVSKKFMTIPIAVSMVFIGGLILNTIISVISAAILKKESLHE